MKAFLLVFSGLLLSGCLDSPLYEASEKGEKIPLYTVPEKAPDRRDRQAQHDEAFLEKLYEKESSALKKGKI